MALGLNGQNPNNIPYAGIKDVTANVGNAVQTADIKGAAQTAAADIKDTAVNDSFIGAANELMDTSPKGIARTLGIWGGLALFVQHFSKRAFEGKWEDSIFYKMQKAGDTVTKAFKNNKLGGKIYETVTPKFSALKTTVLDKVPFLNTPLRSVNSLAKSQGNGVKSFVASDSVDLLKRYISQGNECTKLGFATTEAAQEFVAKLASAPGDAKLTKDLARRFHNMGIKGASASENLNTLKKFISNAKRHQDLGFTTEKAALEFLAKISDTPHDNKLIKELMTRLRDSGNKVYTADKLMGKIPNIPFLKRTTSFNQIANKLQATSGAYTGSGLGKAMVSSFSKLFESSTNGFAGGKLLIGIQAMIFAGAIKKTAEAPKGEKLSTFMDAIFSDLMYLVTLPLTMKFPNALGGMKYMGMGKNAASQVANVEKFSSAIKALNEGKLLDKAGNEIGKIENYAQYMRSKDVVKNMLWGEKLPKSAKFTEKLARALQKPFKMAGNFFSTGLEPIKSYQMPLTGKFGDFGRKIVNSMAKGADALKHSGGLMRAVVAMLVVSPILVRGLTKVSHFIFGRPTKSSLDEHDKAKAEKKAAKEEAKKAKEEAKQKRLEELQNPQAPTAQPQVQSTAQPQVQSTVQTQPAPAAPRMSPFMQAYLKNGPQGSQAAQTPAQASVQTLTSPATSPMAQNDFDAHAKQPKPSASPKEVKPEEPKEPVRTYIPSSAPAKNSIEKKSIKDFDPGLQTIISRSEAAEANARKFLQ